MGTHSLPNVLGRRTGTPRDQRLCQHCTLHAIHDEKHLVLECPAMQPVRDRYPALFSPACSTMQLFMWQPDTVGVAHYILDCFDFLGALSDAPDDASTSSLISPGGWIDVIHSLSFIHCLVGAVMHLIIISPVAEYM